MAKEEGAFLTIGELSVEIGVPQHILRYWETRFPQLKPLQRAGNRRYYRPADVELVRRINRLLNVEGFTVRGARQMLSGKPAAEPALVAAVPVNPDAPTPADNIDPPEHPADAPLIARLEGIRARLGALL